jgi:hypothetical protein
MPRAVKGIHGGQKLAQGSRQTVEPSDDQHITLAGELQGGGKLWAIRSGAAHRFLEYPLAPSRMKGVDLAVSALQIARHAGIAGQHQKSSKTRPTPEQSRRGFQE